MKKTCYVLFAVMLTVFTLTTCTGDELRIPQYDGNLRMRIGIYHAPAPNFLSQEDFNLIADMGIDLLIPEHSTTNFDLNSTSALMQLDHAQKAGLMITVHDPSLQHNLRRTTTDWDTKNVPLYIDHPAFYGVEIKDEPNMDEYKNIKILYDKWKTVFPPDKWFYINLFPGIASHKQLGTDVYRQYVRDYMMTVGTDYLSYDHYPLMGDGTVRGEYFRDLDVLGSTARDYSVPLHSIILTAGHLGYKAITEADIRWQVACVMTFGARAISLYNFHHKEGDNAEACINSDDGKPTPLYYYVRTVNREIKAWDNVYLCFKWEGVAPVAGSHGKPNAMLASIVDSYIKPDGIEGLKSIVSDEDVLCGIFKDTEGGMGYMVTNATNPGEKIPASLTVAFEKKYKGVMVYEKGKSRIITLDRYGKAKINLEPGEGKFLIPLKKK